MRFVFYSPVHFEPWCWRNSVETGIGGSETSHVEMCWRLARRGHECVSYVPLPDDVPSGSEWRGTKWFRLEEVDWRQPGVWVLYRCPKMTGNFFPMRKDQVLWLIMQDWDYGEWTPGCIGLLDRIVPLCDAHRDWLLKRHPDFDGKLWVTRNGVKAELITDVGRDAPERNLRRIMYASSPDRGLLAALKVFRRAKEFVPDLELHVTYGWDNADKLIVKGARHLAKLKDECQKLIGETGAVMHGRLSQNQLYREWFRTAITVYITGFWETGWITGLEAQAMGAIPVFSPIWAQGENTKHGFPVEGKPDAPLTLCRAAAEVVRLAKHPELQERIRPAMMADVRERWGWERFVDQWIEAAEEDSEKCPVASNGRIAACAAAV